MKKILSTVLTLSLIISSLIPLNVFASGEEQSKLIRRPVPTEFEMSNAIDDLKYYTTDNYDKFYNNISIGNEILTTYDFYNNSAIAGSKKTYGTAEVVTIEDTDYTKAVRIDVNTIPSSETALTYNIGTNNLEKGVITLDEDATYLLSFSARLISGGTNGQGTIKHQIQENTPEENDSYKKALFKETTINSEWNTYYIPFKAVSGYSTYTYSIRIGYAVQTIEIADLRITYQGTEYTPDTFPLDTTPAINPTLLSTYEANTLSSISGTESSKGSFELVDVENQTFNKAIRLTTNEIALDESKLLFRVGNQNENAGLLTLNENSVYVISFYARLISGGNESGYGVIKHQVQETTSASYTKAVFTQSLIGSTWKKYCIPFEAVLDNDGEYYTEYKYDIRFGYNVQSIEIADLKITNQGSTYDISEYPIDIANKYPYLTKNQQWRNDALERIETIRKGDFKVVVKDTLGNPVKDAKVELDMFEHQFPFGSCANGNVSKTTEDAKKYKNYFAENFNAMVHETVLKWGPYEKDRDNGKNTAQEHIDILKALGVKYFRGHQLVWERMQSSSGTWLTAERMASIIEAGDRDTFDTETEAHIKEVIQKYPDITEWDVLNEEVKNRLMRDSFNDELIPLDWLEWSREYASPGTKLVYNEAVYIDNETFYTFLDMLKANDAPVDIIGLQSHYNTCAHTPEETLETYSKIKDEYGYDVKVTEFSCGEIFDEELQASYLRDMLIAAFSHEAVKGFLFWGFWDGSVYTTVSPFYTTDWKLKEAGKQYQDLVYNKWWTKDEIAYTNENGEATIRGYYGNYDVTVSTYDDEKTVEAVFFDNTDNTIEITVNSYTAPEFTQDAHSFIYSGKVVVEGKSDSIDSSLLNPNYLHDSATLLLVKNDGNPVSASNILNIQQTKIDANGNYRFEFVYDKFQYKAKEEMSDCYIIVNINGKNATDTVVSSDVYPNCLSLDFDTSTTEGKLSLSATINNLISKSGLDISVYTAFYSESDKMLGLTKTVSSLSGNEKDIIKINDLVIPDDASNAKVMFWVNNSKLIPIFGAKVIDNLK